MTKRVSKRKPKCRLSKLADYDGELAEPIFEPLINSGLEGNSALSKNHAESRALAKQAEKLALLFDWYRIDRKSPKRWIRLSIALALTHVPGMEITDKAKAKSKHSFWKAGGYRSLVEDIDEILAKDKNHKRGSIKRAINQLKSDKPEQWRKIDFLDVRLREARRFVAKEDARQKSIEEKYRADGFFAAILRLSERD